jgi:hypothetical protein
MAGKFISLYRSIALSLSLDDVVMLLLVQLDCKNADLALSHSGNLSESYYNSRRLLVVVIDKLILGANVVAQKFLHPLVRDPTDRRSHGMEQHASRDAARQATVALVTPQLRYDVDHAAVLLLHIALRLQPCACNVQRIGDGGREHAGATASKTMHNRRLLVGVGRHQLLESLVGTEVHARVRHVHHQCRCVAGVEAVSEAVVAVGFDNAIEEARVGPQCQLHLLLHSIHRCEHRIAHHLRMCVG